MLSLLVALQAASAPATVATQEIVVTAKHDRCFIEHGSHPVSDGDLKALSQSWELGSPVRVIEPRGANLKCEFQIMRSLAAHGQHVAQFVARSEDLSPEEEKAEQAERAADEQKAAQQAATAETPPMPLAPATLMQQETLARPVSTPARGRGSPAAAPAGRSIVESQPGLVTLTCTMADPVKPYQLDVVVNEEKGTVTPSRPDTGSGSEMKGVFMPDAVRFGPFMISRITLRIWRQNGGNAAVAAKQPAIVEGQCALAALRRVF